MKKMIAIYIYDDKHKECPIFILKEDEFYEAMMGDNTRYEREEVENNNDNKWFISQIEMDENVAKLF